MNSRINNPMEMITRFNQFKNAFTGNPKEEVQKLIANGQMNQMQLNQLQQMATQFQNILSNTRI